MKVYLPKILVLHPPRSSIPEDVREAMVGSIFELIDEKDAKRLLREKHDDVYLVLTSELIRVLDRDNKTSAANYFRSSVAQDVYAFPKDCCKVLEFDGPRPARD